MLQKKRIEFVMFVWIYHCYYLILIIFQDSAKTRNPDGRDAARVHGCSWSERDANSSSRYGRNDRNCQLVSCQARFRR